MKQSWKKKLVASAAAGVLALAMAAPVAAFGDTDSDLPLDNSITVSGLDEGDSAEYYQIIHRDPTTGQWVFTESVDKKSGDPAKQDGVIDGTESITFGDHQGLTIEDLRVKQYNSDGTPIDPVDYEVITSQMANYIIAALQSNGKTAADGTMDMSGGTATKTFVPTNPRTDEYAGLYMVVALPAKQDVVYKPVFVSSDYDADDNTNAKELVEKKQGSEAEATDYQDKAGVFKKSRLTLDKESGTETDRQQDVSVGDTVDFTIKTNIPTYTKNYTAPEFKITDVLTEGLDLVSGSIVVKVGDSAAPEAQNTAGQLDVKKGNQVVASIEEDGVDGFSVAFTSDYLWDGVLGNPQVVITYKATVTSEAAEQVNQMDNTAKLEFSNNPNDTTKKGEIKDKTRHYTFGLDASIFGQSGGQGEPGKTSELRKIAVDADGNVIEEMTTTELGEEEAYTLAKYLKDAEFELVQTKKYANPDQGENLVNIPEADQKPVKFKDGVKSSDASAVNPVSDEKGFITMKGLDAGVYTLKEIKAPLGYSFDPNKIYTISITPTYTTDLDGNKILASYQVDIAFTSEEGQAVTSTSKYEAKTEASGEGSDADHTPISFLNDAGTHNADSALNVDESGSALNEGNESALIINKKLGLLPATGGSGIFFYVGVGCAIMLLAVGLGMLRRRRLQK